MILRDFECAHCGNKFEDLVPRGANTKTCACGKEANSVLSVSHTFTEIIPTYPGSKKHKAGFQHSHADRPKTPGKIQVAVR